MDIVEASDPRKMDYLAKVLKNLIFSDIQNGDIILHNFGVQEYQGPYEQFKGEIWHYFDLHSPHRHDGKLVRQWYDFPPHLMEVMTKIMKQRFCWRHRPFLKVFSPLPRKNHLTWNIWKPETSAPGSGFRAAATFVNARFDGVENC